MKRKTTEEYIEESKKIWFPKIFEYTNTCYVNNYTHVGIMCLKHGKFSQNPNSHLRKINGCKKCDIERKKNIQTHNTAIFIERAKKREDYKDFIFTKSKYVDAKTKIEIECKEHGIFPVTPDNFLNKKSSCPSCKESKGEKMVSKFLSDNNIKYIKEMRIDKLDSSNKTNLRFDFYIEIFNLIIEYDGIQHYEVVEYFGGIESLLKTKHNDKLKNIFCKNNKINLLRIPYTEFNNIEFILTNTVLCL